MLFRSSRDAVVMPKYVAFLRSYHSRTVWTVGICTYIGAFLVGTMVTDEQNQIPVGHLILPLFLGVVVAPPLCGFVFWWRAYLRIELKQGSTEVRRFAGGSLQMGVNHEVMDGLGIGNVA